jgi:hypothetical protein
MICNSSDFILVYRALPAPTWPLNNSDPICPSGKYESVVWRKDYSYPIDSSSGPDSLVYKYKTKVKLYIANGQYDSKMSWKFNKFIFNHYCTKRTREYCCSFSMGWDFILIIDPWTKNNKRSYNRSIIISLKTSASITYANKMLTQSLSGEYSQKRDCSTIISINLNNIVRTYQLFDYDEHILVCKYNLADIWDYMA